MRVTSARCRRPPRHRHLGRFGRHGSAQPRQAARPRGRDNPALTPHRAEARALRSRSDAVETVVDPLVVHNAIIAAACSSASLRSMSMTMPIRAASRSRSARPSLNNGSGRIRSSRASTRPSPGDIAADVGLFLPAPTVLLGKVPGRPARLYGSSPPNLSFATPQRIPRLHERRAKAEGAAERPPLVH